MTLLKIALMPWPAVDAYLRTANPTILVPISPVEQHGPHLPAGTDFLLTEKVAEAVAEHCGCAVFPTIPLMCCGVSAETTGTYSIQRINLRGIVRDLLMEFARKGFKRVVFITTHWGFSVGAMRGVIREVRSSLKGCIAEVIPLKEVTEIPPGLIVTRGDSHAGEVETSAMQFCFPELVRYPLPPADYHDRTGDVPVLSRSGIDGDPRKATAEKGRKIFDAAVVGVIRRIESRVVVVA